MIEKLLKEDELYHLFESLDDLIQSGIRIFILNGDLASGKTTLVRSYLSYKYLDREEKITSPTFSLMHDYGGVYHYDLYRLEIQEFLEFGLLENLDRGIHFIEWGEKLAGILKNSGYNYATVHIAKADDRRNYRIVIGS